MNEPRKRKEWEGIHIVPVSKVGGRTGAGARNHCMHLDNVSMFETVLDWRPFDYFTVEQNSGAIPGMVVNITYKLTQTPTGTRTEQRERWMDQASGRCTDFFATGGT